MAAQRAQFVSCVLSVICRRRAKLPPEHISFQLTVMSLKEILAPANLLSLSRIPFAIWIVTLLPYDDAPSESLPAMRLAVFLLALAGLTDFLDGIFARRAEVATGKKNPYGIVFDPVADKIFAIVLIFGLIANGMFPFWLAAIVLGRDIVIMGAGAMLARKYELVLPSNLPGKYYFASLSFLLAAYLAEFETAIVFLEILTVALWGASSWFYVRVLRTALMNEQKRTSQQEHGQNLTGSRFRAFAIVFFFATLIVLFARENPLQLW